MKKSVKNNIVFWIPRVLVIIFILFLALFSLDIFGNSYTFWETVIGLFMHNLPSLFLLVILAISWKHDLFGAIAFGVLGVLGIIGTLFMPFTISAGSSSGFNPIFIILGVVCIIVSVLFFLGWKNKGKKRKD